MIGVCGATGRIGSEVLELARMQDLPAIGIREPGVQHRGDADEHTIWREATYEDAAQMVRAFEGADAVLLVTPPDPRQVWWQRNIIDAAIAAGVSRVVKVSAFAARLDSPTNMGRWHFDGELALEASGLEHVVVRPQYFMDNLLRAADGIRVESVLRSIVPPGHPIAMIDVRDVAEVCFELLSGRQVSGIVVPTGPEALGMAEVAERMGAALGRALRYQFLDHGRARVEMSHEGMAEWRIHDALAITSDCGPEVTSVVADLTGRKGRSIEDFVTRHRATFTM